MANEMKQNEMKQFWVASNGSITLFDFEAIDEEVEDFIGEKWGDCEWGELSSFTDMRREDDKEKWFNQQGFKGTSWNYVLDQAEIQFKCSLNSEMNDKERLIHDCLFKLWNKLKDDEEEEEEEEERPLCRNCEIETRKHCDDCGGYGSHSELESEEEDDEEEENEKNVQCARCGKEGDCDKDDFQYLPSKEDEETHSMLGEDMCLKCFEQFSEFAFVEDIKEV